MIKKLLAKIGVLKMKKALIVGMENYKGCKPLIGCINDAQEVYKLLSKNEDGSPNFSCIQKNDITTRELTYEIRKLFSEDLDIALFYFSGHGATYFDDEYICTYDSDNIIPGIKTSDILSTVNSSKCKNKIIILDSCFSGGMGHTSLIQNADLLAKGVTIITSSCDNQTSGMIGGRSIFTALLCQALKGGASNLFGQITPGSVYAFIDKALSNISQRPVFKSNIHEFITLRTVNQRIANGELKLLTTLFPTPDFEFQLNPSFEDTNTDIMIEDNVKKFKILQLYNQNGLVIPSDEQFMYFAAMKSKTCILTPLGKYYWTIISKKNILGDKNENIHFT